MLTHTMVQKLLIENTTDNTAGLENALEIMTDCTSALFLTALEKGLDPSTHIETMLGVIQNYARKLAVEGKEDSGDQASSSQQEQDRIN